MSRDPYDGGEAPGLFGSVRDILRVCLGGVAAVILGHLPARHWRDLDFYFPVRSLAPVSALVLFFGAFVVGVPAFFRYVEAAGAATVEVMLATAYEVNKGKAGRESVAGAWATSLVGLPAFLLFTPPGWLTLYLALSGLARAVASAAGSPFGDPVLTGVDHAIRHVAARWRADWDAAERERLEGPEVPDVLLRGERVGAPEAPFALVASRRKAEWTEGTFILTPDNRYRIGVPYDRTFPGGLRTVYPLVEPASLEVMRRFVECELPPLDES